MPLQKKTRDFLIYLHHHPEVRNRIKALPNRTLLYCGECGVPMWTRIDNDRRRLGTLTHKQTLPDVLKTIDVPGAGFSSLAAYVDELDSDNAIPWKPDKFVVWRALSGLFARGAVGKVSFMVGGKITADTKVFAATEFSVLARNRNVDPLTIDLLCYYQKCLLGAEPMNLSFISA